MLFLSFRGLGRSSSLGPVESIEFRGGAIFTEGDATARAHYMAGQWVFADRRWPYAECKAWLLLQFADYHGQMGPLVGPRPSMRLRDRFIFAGRERVATLLPIEQRWRVAGKHESWPVLRMLARPDPKKSTVPA
jgi:hypothetical protein